MKVWVWPAGLGAIAGILACGFLGMAFLISSQPKTPFYFMANFFFLIGLVSIGVIGFCLVCVVICLVNQRWTGRQTN